MGNPAPDFDLRLVEVREALSTVTDPELDESITELGFVRSVVIVKQSNVTIEFRLPTYWCSANFAYLMASDMREAVSTLPWVREVSIRLLDHFTSDQVSEGASAGRAFQESFPLEAEDDLESVRHIFRQKSFQKRQEKLLRYLIGQELEIRTLVNMSTGVLLKLPLDDEGDHMRQRYLDGRRALGQDGSTARPAFLDVEGNALHADTFAGYLLTLRRVRLNAEFNATICRQLLEVRYGVKQEDGLVQIKGMASILGQRSESVRT
jgi:metal-sulfur cluster biosynthetic enzyme